MALAEFLFGIGKKAKIGLVTLDASVEESHEKQVEMTMHPVEEGADITDHLRRLPESVRIHGVISNYPVLEFLPAALLYPSPVESDNTRIGDRAQRADKEFRRVMDTGELITVVTTLREYKNMVLMSYGATRDSKTGAVLDFNIELREILLVNSERVSKPVPVNPVNTKTEDLGKKNGVPADAATEDKALDAQIFDALAH